MKIAAACLLALLVGTATFLYVRREAMNMPASQPSRERAGADRIPAAQLSTESSWQDSGKVAASVPPDAVASVSAGSRGTGTNSNSRRDAEFVKRTRSAEIRRLFHHSEVPPTILKNLLDARVHEAARQLEQQAAGGNAASNVLLARLLAFCDALARPEPRNAEAPADSGDLSPTAGAEAYFSAMTHSCRATQFDRKSVEQRLHDAGNSGHAESLLVLGEKAEDFAARRKLWMSAAMLGNAQAQAQLAFLLSEQAENDSGALKQEAEFWQAAAADHSPVAATAFAFCLVDGCNGRPSDTEAGRERLLSAVRLGDLGALRALHLAHEKFSIPGDQRYAWALFERRLRERGCFGERASRLGSLTAADRMQWRRVEDLMSPFEIESGRRLAEQYWLQFGPAALRSQQCE